MKNKDNAQQEVNQIIYNKESIIRRITDECGRKFENIRTEKDEWQSDRIRAGEELTIVRGIYNILEDTIMKLLSSTSPANYITLKLFEGISIDSEFLPEKDKVNNLTGKSIVTTSKVKAKANVTRNYCDKLTACNKNK